MILYAIYNAPLIESTTPGSKDKLAVGFVDDMMFLAIADTLEDAHAILGNVMERPQGGLEWSLDHNSPLELSKLALGLSALSQGPCTS